jgi:hypothetical protein
MDKALVIVMALGLAAALWFCRRSGRNTPDRPVAKVQVLLWSGLLFGYLPRAVGYEPSGLAIASFSLSGLFLLATLVQLVRGKRARRV